MNTTKHTPGPWMCEESDGNLAKVTVTRNGLRSVIARLHDNSLCNEHRGSSSANAHLIAAAPAMYEALQQAQELIRSLVAEEMIHSTELQRVGNCQATMWQALAQAEGKA